VGKNADAFTLTNRIAGLVELPAQIVVDVSIRTHYSPKSSNEWFKHSPLLADRVLNSIRQQMVINTSLVDWNGFELSSVLPLKK